MWADEYSKSKNKDKKSLNLVEVEGGNQRVYLNIPMPVNGHFSRRRLHKDKSRIVKYEAVNVFRWKLHLFSVTWVRYTTTETEIEPGGGYVIDDKAEVWTEQKTSPWQIQGHYELRNEGWDAVTFEQVQRDVVAVQKWAMMQPWPDNFIKLGRKIGR